MNLYLPLKKAINYLSAIFHIHAFTRAVHGPLWGAGVGRLYHKEAEPPAGLVSEGHGDQDDPRIPHGLRGGGEPPCRTAAVGSGGECACHLI